MEGKEWKMKAQIDQIIQIEENKQKCTRNTNAIHLLQK